MLQKLLPDELQKHKLELSTYLNESFGNDTRIDYGTGHEMNFVIFLHCLFKIEFLSRETDLESVGLCVFHRYMQLARALQKRFRMEPAGSQGVWALDDYQFVPFIWGAAQFIRDGHVEPKSIPDHELAQKLSPDYHFFGCIQYIYEVKSGPFAEHSNQVL